TFAPTAHNPAQSKFFFSPAQPRVYSAQPPRLATRVCTKTIRYTAAAPPLNVVADSPSPTPTLSAQRDSAVAVYRSSPTST
ncbi:hypothetical protein U1Q18_038751, partial [Sarracenia purpurea var. burkii]